MECLHTGGESQTVRYLLLAGVKWSPDGACMLTNSDDTSMRLWELPRDYDYYSGRTYVLGV